MAQSIDIQMLSRSDGANKIDMKRIAYIVNLVYADSERDFWKDRAARTNTIEITEFTNAGELAVARAMGEIIGCVRVRQMDEETGEFGMLAVDIAYQGNGIGRKLIDFAEEKCRTDQLHKMKLELLVPQEGSHPEKARLESWYTRLGYRRIHTEAVEALFPSLAQQLAMPCKFLIFQKELEEQ